MQKTQKGITLIAIIITIIVMLILVGVSVNIALENGLFKAAQSGAKNTELAKQKETELSSGKVEIPADLQIGDYVTGYDPTPVYNNGTNYKVEASLSGADSDQTFTEDTSLGWRVLSIDRETGRVELIADNATSTTLTLKGAHGWNNSIDILNTMCQAIYSMEGVGTARSINVEDINTISGYTPTTGSTYNASNFGSNNKFPIEYLKEKGITNFTASEISNGYAENSSIDVTGTDYYYTPEIQSGYKGTSRLIGLVKYYWLASRCVQSYSYYADFMVRSVDTIGRVNYYYMLSSNGYAYAPSYAVRPVISLESRIRSSGRRSRLLRK